MKVFKKIITAATLNFCLIAISNSATLNINITDQNNLAVKDAVITLTGNKNHALVPTEKLIIDQINKTYVPHVKTVVVGSKIFFPNKDDIRHHVYSFSEAKKFELPLYEGTPADPVTFNQKGLVTLGCNIHDWMRGYIYIIDTPFFSQTNNQGSAVIKNIPKGIYKINVWQPRILNKQPLQAGTIKFDQGNNKHFKQQLTLRQNIKIRRAPKNRKKRY